MKRRRASMPVWTPGFIVWCVALILLSAAGGFYLGTALAGR